MGCSNSTEAVPAGVSVVLKAPPKCDDAAFMKLVSDTKNIDTVTHLYLGGAEPEVDCYITDRTLKFIGSRFPNLVELDLQMGRGITDEGIEHIAKLSGITSLNLFNCNRITDSGLEYISKLRGITSLNLTLCGKITDAGIDHLSRLSAITSLNLSWCRKITDASLRTVSRLSHITSLNLRECENITDTGLRFVSKLSAITDLDLRGCKITDNAITHLRSSMPNCEILVSP